MEPGIEKIVHQHFSNWPLGRSEVFERKNEEIWRMSMRTDSRRGKVEVCHQNSGMKELPVSRQCVLKQEAHGVYSREIAPISQERKSNDDLFVSNAVS